jgi:membrane protein
MSDAVFRRVNEHRARQDGRGRAAERPTHIPRLGWKDILYRVKDEISQDRIGTIAGGTTFFLVLSLFPAIGAMVSLYGLVADPATIQQHIEIVRGYVPSAALDLFGEELKRLSQEPKTLGLRFAVTLAIALWSANSGVKALFDALNVAYDEDEKRGFLALNASTMAFTVGAIVFLILLLNVVVGVPVVVKLLYLGPFGDLLVTILPALVLLALASVGIAMLYRYGPSRTRARWHWITPGSLVAAFVWLATSAAFSWYLANFANYSATYGSLGAIIGVMMWVYISMWIVLVGAELNAEIEHQTARDTTVGPDKPLGTRGATMADRVGESRG